MRTRDTDKEDIVKRMTIETVAKDGLDGFTIAKLAKACNISVGTPYVYYKDKDDLIISIVLEEGKKMDEYMNRNFDPELSLEDGLRVQWRNRTDYQIEYPYSGRFLDQIRSSAYQDQLLEMFTKQKGNFLSQFKKNVEHFVANVIERKEMDAMPYEEYWCVAFAPLYSLLRFHQEGRSITGHPFQMTEEILWSTFDRVIIALKTADHKR